MTPFSCLAPRRTVFGRGCRKDAVSHIKEFGRHVLLVRSGSVSWADTLERDLTRSGLSVEVIASGGEPTLDQIEKARADLASRAVDCVVAIGGGATLDFGKALAAVLPAKGELRKHLEVAGDGIPLESDPLPYIAMPTTSGTGAEATKNAVIAVLSDGVKVSLRDERMIPDLALIDPALTDDLPKHVTLATGLDAVTQLIESYLCIRANPITDALCRDGIPAGLAALSRLMDGEDPGARDIMARASYLSGIALANSGLGIVHGLAAVIGARGGAHGAICGRLLPAALDVNAERARAAELPAERFAEVDGWLLQALPEGGTTATVRLRAFMNRHGLPSLADLNCPDADFDEIATQGLAASSTKGNPVRLSHTDVFEILSRTSAP